DDEGLARYLDAATRRELEIAAHLRLLTEGDLCRARERDVEIGAGELHVSTEAEAEQPRQGPAPSLLRLSERLDHLDGFVLAERDHVARRRLGERHHEVGN